MNAPFVSRRSLVTSAVLSATPARSAPAAIRLPRRVRLVLVGLYGPTGEVLNALPQLPDVDLVAIADSDQGVRERFTKQVRWRGVRGYANYREMLDREKVDVAGIFNANYERAEAIVECAGRGIHVVSEKPLAIESADLLKIRDAVRKGKIQITSVLPMRYYPHYQAMKRAVASGAVGEVLQVSAQKSYKITQRPAWFKTRKLFGGTIPWIGIHMIDLMRWVSGRELAEAASFQARLGFPELGDMETTTATMFRMDNNGTATLHMDYYRPPTAPTHGDDRLRLAGTGGVIEYRADSGVILMTRTEKPQTVEPQPPQGGLFTDFLEMVYNGRQNDLTSEEVLRLTDIVLRARDAAESHRLVRL